MDTIKGWEETRKPVRAVVPVDMATLLVDEEFAGYVGAIADSCPQKSGAYPK